MSQHGRIGRVWLTVVLLASSAGIMAVAGVCLATGRSLEATIALLLTLILALALSALLYVRERDLIRSQLDAAKSRSSLAQDELKRSEDRFRQLIDQAADAILVYDSRFRFVEANRQACVSLGYSREELLALSVPDVELPTLEVDRGELQKDMLDGHAVTAEMRYRRKDGSTFPAEVRLNLLSIGGRAYKSLLIRDITERQHVLQALFEQRNLLRNVIENIPCAVSWKDRNSVYLGCNGMFARSRGLTKLEEIIGKTDQELGWTSTQSNGPGASDADVLRTGQPVLNEERTRQMAISATPVFLLNSIVPLFDDSGSITGTLSVSTDITERKRLEERFRQSQKMEAVGRLAGGIAHDFNNLLTIINNYAQLVGDGLASEDPSRGMLAKVVEAGERAASLTGQLLAYSRRQVLQPKVLDINQLVTNLGRLLRPLIGEDIELAMDLGNDIECIRVDPGQFEQVLMNLAVNARDAMPKGGKLMIRTRNFGREDVPVVADSTYQPCSYVMIEVRDTGMGMDAKTKSHIFEPFFTTKEVGKGTGLGLATVHGIIKQSGGFIAVESEIGAGTSFQIYIPATEKKPETVSESRFWKFAVPKGSETVLLVEDESGLRTLTRTLLEKSGYRVLEAAGGAEALNIASRHDGPIHMLLTDVVMPGMSGRQLSEIFLHRHQEAKVLYVSGYTDDAIVTHGVQSNGTAFLPKPFSLRSLALKVREVLDADN